MGVSTAVMQATLRLTSRTNPVYHSSRSTICRTKITATIPNSNRVFTASGGISAHINACLVRGGSMDVSRPEITDSEAFDLAYFDANAHEDILTMQINCKS